MLVLYPILGIYKLPIGIDVPLNAVVFFILFIVTLATKRKFKFRFPPEFLLYWGYISIVYIVFASEFSVSLLIPGGFSFCFWVAALLVSLFFFDYSLLKRYYRIAFIVCASVFFIQEISYFALGSRPIFLLPFPLTGDEPYEVILANQIKLDRSSCFFREPSHFAQFALPLLAIELIDAPRKGKIFTNFSLFIMATLVFLRSGNGFFGLIILVAIRVWDYMKYAKLKYKLLTVFCFVPLILAVAFLYIQTEQGMAIADRASGVSLEEGSSSFMRTFRGYFLYAVLPTINKFFGIGIDNVMDFILHSRVAYLFISPITGEYENYLNGVQTILVSNGLVGLILFVWYYVRLYIKNISLSRSLIILFLSLMLIGNLYLSQTMLLCTVIPWFSKRRVARIKRKRKRIVLNEGLVRS